ncbi:hypothetical protein [Verminephrobacter eiseniae]|uniref:hypothetical protein n=1 Tax=Verminephrobacter eiseniae TaxID=364317 RepID=UPI0003116241|nr:hypothetical protein [Verminephrobacter eiseniae]MCW8191744.1 hypothetical protein [Verminephrobacter eiseniae]
MTDSKIESAKNLGVSISQGAAVGGSSVQAGRSNAVSTAPVRGLRLAVVPHELGTGRIGRRHGRCPIP